MSTIVNNTCRTLFRKSSLLCRQSRAQFRTTGTVASQPEPQLRRQSSCKADGYASDEHCLILFMAGAREKGFISSVAQIVYNLGGNIEKSNHAILGKY